MMPLYSFQCISCGHSDEFLMKMSQSEDLVPCDLCNGDMKRVIGSIENQLIKWTRRYKDETGQESVLETSPPGGSYRKTNYKKGKRYGKGKHFIYNKVTGKVEERD